MDNVLDDEVPSPREIKSDLRKDQLDDIVPIFDLDTGDISMNNMPDLYESYYPKPNGNTKITKEGTLGFSINLTTNHFAVDYENTEIYQYEVNFIPNEENIGDQRKRLSIHHEFLGTYIFNGTSLFSNKLYSPRNFELRSKRIRGKMATKVTVKYVAKIIPDGFSLIRIMNSLFNISIENLKFIQFGQIYCDSSIQQYVPKHRFELWHGYKINVTRSDSRQWLLHIDVVKEAVHDKNVMEFFLECKNNYGNNYMESFKAGIIGTTVLTNYNKKTYKICDVADACIDSTFIKKDGTEISYKDFYLEKYSITFKYTNYNKQPLLVTERKKLSGEVDLIHLIPELCVLTGFAELKKDHLDFKKFKKNYLSLEPHQHINLYTSIINRLNSTPMNLLFLRRWNLTLNNNLFCAPSRILPPPFIFTKGFLGYNRRHINWINETKKLPMFKCATIKNWVVLTPCHYKTLVETFVLYFQKAAKEMSFLIPDPEIITTFDLSVDTYMISLEETLNKKNPFFVLCVMSLGHDNLFNLINQKLCVERAVPSQIVLMEEIQKIDISVFIVNMTVQVNCKLGGAPWFVEIDIENLMIVGIDVYYDDKHAGILYGALVASINKTHTRYFSCSDQCANNEELSEYFKKNIIKAFLKYKSRNGKFPTNILIYRNVVDYGQTSYIYNNEITMIKDAFKEIDTKIPCMTFILVNKNNGTKFFYNMNGKEVNPRIGTVIDRTVTDPNMYDFYLISHYVKPNISTIPTYYIVLEDTICNWCPDTIQRLTYKLTHMYFNQTYTARVPAVCKFAQKLSRFTANTLKTTADSRLENLLYYL